MKKTDEKINKALLYPPRTSTIAPNEKTAMVVNTLPKLKQNPVAPALIAVGKSCGI